MKGGILQEVKGESCNKDANIVWYSLAQQMQLTPHESLFVRRQLDNRVQLRELNTMSL